MKVFSDTPVVKAPIHKITTIASGFELPNKETPPLLFFHKGNRHLFIGDETWDIIPYGTDNMLKAYRAACNIVKFKKAKLPIEGGTYLIDDESEHEIAMPVGAMVYGVPYTIKNLGTKEITLFTNNEETIEGYEKYKIPANTTCTLQFCENWYITSSHVGG